MMGKSGCLCVGMCVCMSVCMYVWCMYVCVYVCVCGTRGVLYLGVSPGVGVVVTGLPLEGYIGVQSPARARGRRGHVVMGRAVGDDVRARIAWPWT